MSVIKYFDLIPNEILVHIFEFVDQKTLMSLQKVCHRFLIDLPFENFDLFIYDTDVDILKILKRFKPNGCSIYVKELPCLDDFFRILRILNENIYYFKNMDFSSVANIDDSLFEFIDSNDDSYTRILSKPLSINLSKCVYITEKTIDIFKSEIYKYIDLSYCTKLEWMELGKRIRVGRHKENYGTVNLTGCINLNPKSLYYLRKNKVVILDYCLQIKDEDLVEIIEKPYYSGYNKIWRPNILAISLKGCVLITGRFIDMCPDYKFQLCSNEIIRNVDQVWSNRWSKVIYICIEECTNFEQQYLDLIIKQGTS